MQTYNNNTQQIYNNNGQPQKIIYPMPPTIINKAPALVPTNFQYLQHPIQQSIFAFPGSGINNLNLNIEPVYEPQPITNNEMSHIPVSVAPYVDLSPQDYTCYLIDFSSGAVTVKKLDDSYVFQPNGAKVSLLTENGGLQDVPVKQLPALCQGDVGASSRSEASDVHFEAERSRSVTGSSMSPPFESQKLQKVRKNPPQKTYGYRSKQIKIDRVHRDISARFEDCLAAPKELVRGNDTVRVNLKKYHCLTVIEKALDEICHIPGLKVVRIALPLSKKNSKQKKGFIVYLKVNSPKYVETMLDIFRSYNLNECVPAPEKSTTVTSTDSSNTNLPAATPIKENTTQKVLVTSEPDVVPDIKMEKIKMEKKAKSADIIPDVTGQKSDENIIEEKNDVETMNRTGENVNAENTVTCYNAQYKLMSRSFSPEEELLKHHIGAGNIKEILDEHKIASRTLMFKTSCAA